MLNLKDKAIKMRSLNTRRSSSVTRSWMANLAISLLILTFLVSCTQFTQSFQLPGGRRISTLSRRETNPPFPVYSEEVEPQTDDDILTTTRPISAGSEEEEEAEEDLVENTTLREEVQQNAIVRRNKSQIKLVTNDVNANKAQKNISKESEQSLDQEFQPTENAYLHKQHSRSQEEDPSAEESSAKTYTSLLSPAPTRQSLGSASTPFSSILMNKTARYYTNNHSNANSFRPGVANTNNNAITSKAGVAIKEDDKNVTSSLRDAKPTSSVIHNPTTYNRIVKRRKITSINGRNSARNDVESGLTTVIPPLEGDDLPSSTDPEEELPTTSPNPRAAILEHQNSSRAIAGFSSKKGHPVRIVTKSRPKPIIIRDHEAYFRNLTTETATTENVLTDFEESTQPPPQANNVEQAPSHHHPHMKVRKVKVTMSRRPGPGIVGTVTSDHPLQAVQENITAKSTTISHSQASPAEDKNSNNIRIDPTPTPAPEEFSSKRVFKEEFGIQTNSYGPSSSHHEHDDEDEHGFPSTLEDGEDEQHGELEVDATTEHYYAVHIPTNTNNKERNSVRFNNFKIESSGPTKNADGDTPRIGHVRVSSTPKYRDYFAEVNAPTGASGSDTMDSHNTDNLNHLYGTGGGVKGDDVQIHPSSSPSSASPSSGPAITVTVTKTLVPEEISPTTPTYNITNIEYQIPSPVSANNFFNSFVENTTTTTRATPTLPPNDNSPSNNNVSPQVSNSVEESNHSHNETLELYPTSVTPTPKVTFKEATTVFYTKVEEPHFTSSSYEFSTTKEYSYGTNHSDEEHHDEDEDDLHHHDHPEHAEESQHGNSTNSLPSPTPITPNGTFTTSTTFTTSAATASSSQVPVVLISPKPTIGEETFSTDKNFPEISHNDISEENQSQEKKESNKKEGKNPLIKGLPTVNVPVMYQVPVLVKMEVEVPQKMFCSHLAHFKQMIVMIYGRNKQRYVVDEDQIVIYTEPNCTSTEDIVPTDASKPKHGGELLSSTASSLVKTSTTTYSPTKLTPVTAKNDTTQKPSVVATTTISTSTSTSPEKVGNKTVENVLRRRRRKRSPQKGESLILENKKNLNNSNSSGGFNLSQTQSLKNSSKIAAEVVEVVSVYFYLKDKQGNYDQELTMAFYEFWNQSQAMEGNENGTLLQGVFYQKIKKVDMVSASQLVLPDDETNENSGIIVAIAIASIAATCLFLIGVLLLVLRHRQSQTKFAKRCTPVTLDDYSLDNISFSNSFRRKQRLRGSKRSYTNAAFEDHTAPSRVVNSATLHTALTDTLGLDVEFKAIPNVSPTLDDIPQGAEAKNRYANVIPMPDTRVLLTFQEEQPNSDYINANFARGQNGEPKRYIITQGPLEETVVDFWRMIWEQQVRVIFMLTDFAEAGHSKCAEYYPRSETIDCSQLHGDFQVTLEKRDITENCITSYLVIKDMERNLRRDVIHLWFCSWPDKGVPSGGKPTVDFLLKSRKFTKEPTPVVVHCSPGTGRSGTVVACDIAMKEFELQQKVDIPRIVLRLRQDRAACVQTKEQYIHIYEALHYFSTRYAATKMEPIGSVP